MAQGIKNPLIPAQAGTQAAYPRLFLKLSLGPGLRRGERLVGASL
jgi:hypothetical protein